MLSVTRQAWILLFTCHDHGIGIRPGRLFRVSCLDGKAAGVFLPWSSLPAEGFAILGCSCPRDPESTPLRPTAGEERSPLSAGNRDFCFLMLRLHSLCKFLTDIWSLPVTLLTHLILRRSYYYKMLQIPTVPMKSIHATECSTLLLLLQINYNQQNVAFLTKKRQQKN